MLLQTAILIGGLLLILLGANWLVDGSSSIAKRFGISEFVIGLTIVGIGTSAPEMVVSFLSAFQGKTDMAIGNIVGSNIFNSMMILGVTALIAPLTITKSNLKKDIPLNIIVTALLIILGMNFTIFGKGADQLCRLDGAILLGLFAWYLWSSFRSDSGDSEGEGIKEYKTGVSVILIIAGLAGLIAGGKLFVNAATELAKAFGVSDKFIAITVMAAGTSMPELASSLVSVFKGNASLALGNVLGSNIANILLILGACSTVTPLTMGGVTMTDVYIVVASTFVLMLSALVIGRDKLTRVEGLIFIACYVGYVYTLL